MNIRLAAASILAATAVLSGCASEAKHGADEPVAAAAVSAVAPDPKAGLETYLAWARGANIVDEGRSEAFQQAENAARMLAEAQGSPTEAKPWRSYAQIADERRAAIGNAVCEIASDSVGSYGKLVERVLIDGATDLTEGDDGFALTPTGGGAPTGPGRVALDIAVTPNLAEDLTRASIANLCPVYAVLLPA